MPTKRVTQMDSVSGNQLRRIGSTVEAQLLLHCARVQLEPWRAERMRALVSEDLDWERLASLARKNGLSPLVFFHLSKTCPELGPPEWLDDLRNYFRANNAFNLMLSGELVRLLRLFESRGIEALPYKGPAMAAGIYGDLSLRQFCDLDMLVHESDVWQATEVLVQQGFEPHFVIPAEKQQAFIRLSYVRLFRRDGGRTIVELHWRIAPRFFDVPFDTERLFRRSKKIELLGSPVLFPAPQDLLLMLCIHGAKDFWEKLEWVSAIAELLRRNPGIDWDELFEEARAVHGERMLLVGLLLAYELLEAPLPDRVKSRVTASKRVSSIARRAVERFFAKEGTLQFAVRLGFHLSFKHRVRDKLRYCSRLAFTTTPVDWATIALPRSLSFLYLPLRAVRLARRYGVDSRAGRG